MAQIFPRNIVGTNHMNVVATGSTKVLICVDYHSRYEDDDCYGLFYDLETNKFYTDGWSTRGYCEPGFFTRPYLNVNCLNHELQQKLFEAARVEALKNVDNINKNIWAYLTRKYPKVYSLRSINNAREAFQNNIGKLINEDANFDELISMFYNDSLDGYDTRDIFHRWIENSILKMGLTIKTKRNESPRKVKLFGDDYTGKVTWVNTVMGPYSKMYKLTITTEDGRRIYANVPAKKNVNIKNGDTITVNGVVTYQNEKFIRLGKVRVLDNIDTNLIIRVKQNDEVL